MTAARLGKMAKGSQLMLVELQEGSYELIFDFITLCEADLYAAATMGHNMNDSASKLEFAEKLDRNAVVLTTQSMNREINGMIAFYCNDTRSRKAHITYFAVASVYRGHGLAEKLVDACFSYCKLFGMRSVSAETWNGNVRLVRFAEFLVSRWAKSHNYAIKRPEFRNCGSSIQFELFLSEE
jgi:ribosomal protein S18 acetylase RimI-like enzyme